MATFNKLTKIALGTAAAGAMAMSATPASAQYRYDNNRNDDGISAGEIIAGVAIIGGLAAILSGNRNNDRYDNGRYGNYGDYGYNQSRYGGSRQAVSQCVNAARYEGQRYGSQTRVTDVRDIRRTRDGYTVRGTVQVNQDRYGGRYDNRYNNRYGNANGYGDRYGNNGYGNLDNGTFTCRVRNGRVVDVNIRGV